ncbi:MAG: hypothetical protein Crog4KO_06510 [Crocinitomicaceae bacterium]
MVIDKIFQKSRFNHVSREVLKYSLTVGLSGFLIYLVTLSGSDETEKKLDKIIQNQESSLVTIDSLSNEELDKVELDSIDVQNDSIQ